MSFSIGDVVQTNMYDASILYKIVCFLDRGESLTCGEHVMVNENPACPDDVHLEVVWKKHKAIAPAWNLGASVVTSSSKLVQPDNEMLVIALAARGDLDVA